MWEEDLGQVRNGLRRRITRPKAANALWLAFEVPEKKKQRNILISAAAANESAFAGHLCHRYQFGQLPDPPPQ